MGLIAALVALALLVGCAGMSDAFLEGFEEGLNESTGTQAEAERRCKQACELEPYGQPRAYMKYEACLRRC